jgi:hypothetical protein
MRYVDFVFEYIKLFVKFCVFSLYSPEYYQDIYKKFNGWGIRYILTASFIATLIALIPFFNLLVEVKDYFNTDKVSKNIEGLDHIINQFPTLNYNGKSISLDDEEPYYIYNAQDKVFAVIDTRNNNVAYKEEKVILTKDKIILNLKVSDDNSDRTVLPIEYSKIISEASTLNIADLKKLLGHICESAIKVFIYFFFPMLLLLNLVFIIIQKLLNIMIIYVFLNMFINKSIIKDAFRLVMFASAPSVIINQIAFFVPILKNIAPLIEAWSLILMVYSLYRTKTNA